MHSLLLSFALLLFPSGSHDGALESELIFPLNPQHNHAPGVVECPNGDLLVSWYRGSGERRADDVQVLGSRRRAGTKSWSEPFLLADTPEFPDCNTCMWIDSKKQLWLFWPLILANSWESALTRYRTSADFQMDGPPNWKSDGLILLKPADFSESVNQRLDAFLKETGIQLPPEKQKAIDAIRGKLSDKLYQRLGWQPRCKPTELKSGRILLPLYSDTYSISIMAISDDQGANWYASKPLIGFGNIQPSVLERKDGTLVAYMRENGLTDRVRICESKDGGIEWGEVTSSSLLNPGSGLDAVRLANGHWGIIYNDTAKGRNSLAVSISDDEGRSWKWTRHLERESTGSFHYPAIIQGRNGELHAVYSYFVDGGKSMKHATFDEAWVLKGESR